VNEQPLFESKQAAEQLRQNKEKARRNLKMLQVIIAFLGILLGFFIGVSFLPR